MRTQRIASRETSGLVLYHPVRGEVSHRPDRREALHHPVRRMACMAVIAALVVSAPLAGCSKKEGQGTAVETEVPMELRLSCYLTGTSVFTDADGQEKTSIRFLVENDDTENKDWVKGLNGKEALVTGDGQVQVYSRYVNDHCRYVDGIVPGNVDADDVTYAAGTFISSGWKQAGEEQYQEIGAIVEDGIPYFYTGCGVSTGLSGERVMCVWLAGFTPDSVPVDGERPQLKRADRFSLVTADGGEILGWEGMKKKPQLSVNEFGVEVSIQAEDADTLLASIAGTGLTLRHESEDGIISDFELEKKGVRIQEAAAGSQEDTSEAEEATEAAEAAETTGTGEDTEAGESAGVEEPDSDDASESVDSADNTETSEGEESGAGS